MASLSHRCFYSQHTWAENFSNSPLLAAWVTHLDPPVKALAGMASRLAGGVPSSLDQVSALSFDQAVEIGISEFSNLRIWEDFDLETLLEEIEENLALQYSDFAVTSRTKVVINGIDTLRVDGQSTSTEGIVLIHTILLPYESNLAKAIVKCDVLKDQYATLSPILEHIFDSITLL